MICKASDHLVLFVENLRATLWWRNFSYGRFMVRVKRDIQVVKKNENGYLCFGRSRYEQVSIRESWVVVGGSNKSGEHWLRKIYYNLPEQTRCASAPMAIHLMAHNCEEFLLHPRGSGDWRRMGFSPRTSKRLSHQPLEQTLKWWARLFPLE